MTETSVHDMDALASIAEDDCLYVEAGDGSDFGKVDVSVLRSEMLKQRHGANLQTGTTYTLVLSDAGKVVELANDDPITLTIPANGTVAFPVNTVIEVVQGGAGAVTIGITDDTLNGTTTIGGEWSGVMLWKRAATEWVSLPFGTGLSQSQVDARVVAVAPTVATSRTVITGNVSDDDVWTFDLSTLPSFESAFDDDDVFAGNIIVSNNAAGSPNRGIFAIRAAASSASCVAISATGITATTGALAGTTGADATVTISTHTDRKLYIENRMGSARFFAVTINAVTGDGT